MSVIKYSLRVQGEEETFSEQDTFPAGDPTKVIGEIIVEPLNKRRASLSELPLILVCVTVLNPFVHAHSWKRYRICKHALKAYYECDRCRITGYRTYHLFDGEKGALIRDEEFKHKKFDLCHDPLKPLQKTINFG